MGEEEVRLGNARQLGIANTPSFLEVRRIYEEATIKPAVVQQALYSTKGFEHEMREWCDNNGILYQSYFEITGGEGPDVLRQVGAKKGVSSQAIFFRFMMGLGIVPITDATDDRSMKEYIKAARVPLEEVEYKALSRTLQG